MTWGGLVPEPRDGETALEARVHELESELAHLRRVVETCSDAYVAIAADGRVTEWNRVAAEVFGWSCEQAVGVPVDELLIPPEQVSAHRDGLARFHADGHGPILGSVVPVEARRRDGSRLPVELTVWACEGTGGGPGEGAGGSAFHAFLRDVSARAEAEDAAARATAELESFASIAAHDLSTPLAIIRGFAEAALTFTEDPLLVTTLGRIVSAAQRGTDLVQDLLSVVSLERADPVLEPFDLSDVVRSVAEEQVAVRGRAAVVDVAELPRVAADEILVRQLFANLIGNSVKYVPTDRALRIEVRGEPCSATGPDAGRVLVRVSDNGDPIPAEERAGLFELFARGGRASSASGTGIGLAICRKVVERHGGRIWVDGDGPGTTFAVTLPAAP